MTVAFFHEPAELRYILVEHADVVAKGFNI